MSSLAFAIEFLLAVSVNNSGCFIACQPEEEHYPYFSCLCKDYVLFCGGGESSPSVRFVCTTTHRAAVMQRCVQISWDCVCVCVCVCVLICDEKHRTSWEMNPTGVFFFFFSFSVTSPSSSHPPLHPSSLPPFPPSWLHCGVTLRLLSVDRYEVSTR